MNTYIYDIETYKYLFCVVFKDIKTEELTIFEISKRKNETNELLEFLFTKVEKLIGFNNINFDYPVLHWFFKHYNKYITNIDLTNAIYTEANRIIKEEYSAIYKTQVKIPQIDLYKIHHFDNKAKATSLKALEIAMRLSNVDDLPYSIDINLSNEQIDRILDYCVNDVEATYEFYIHSKEIIELREHLTKEYRIDLINANDPKMGEEVLLHFLSKDMNISKRDLRSMRTHREILNFKDYILPYVKFNFKGFRELLNTLKGIRTNTTKDAFKSTVNYQGINFEYGQGGIHACTAPGVYKPKADEIILDLDVKSFYPNLAIANNFRPEHLGDSFGKIYNKLYIERGTYPKSDPRNYALKIALNGAYGKSNDENSFLYDPAFTMQITLNGQLLLTMLIEKIGENIPCEILQANTDGFTILCKKIYKPLLDTYTNQWCKLTKLELEEAFYEKMIIRDVNNYIAINTWSEITEKDYNKLFDKQGFKFILKKEYDKYYIQERKHKGIFEIDRAWHKNHSMLIVPKAISAYYIDNKPIETFVKNADNIFDFSKRGRANKDSKIVSRKILKGWQIKDTVLQKNNRYIVTNTGTELIKILSPLEKDKLKKNRQQTNIFDIVDDVKVSKPREVNLESGYKCTLLNKLEDINPKSYDINYNYYINEIKKIINIIDHV